MDSVGMKKIVYYGPQDVRVETENEPAACGDGEMHVPRNSVSQLPALPVHE